MVKKKRREFIVEEIPSDWKNKIEEMQNLFEFINSEGRSIPKKYKMTPQQYEMYIQNPSNFSEEVWDEIQEVRQKMDAFISDMKTILEISSVKRDLKLKNRLKQKKSWIKVS